MASNVAEFYKNKNIFITGGTGFVGIALVEKILRSCPDVGKVKFFNIKNFNKLKL
jgi:fatty acyl-CoA reductase